MVELGERVAMAASRLNARPRGGSDALNRARARLRAQMSGEGAARAAWRPRVASGRKRRGGAGARVRARCGARDVAARRRSGRNHFGLSVFERDFLQNFE
jgi:hypothetical protein